MLSAKSNIAIIIAAAVIAFLSCDRDRRDFKIASAGKHNLTSGQLNELMPEGFVGQIGEEAVLFVSQWADEIVLAEAAEDLGLAQRPEVAAKLDEARRMILASAYEQFYILPKTDFDTSQVEEYYRNHSQEFVRSQDEVLLFHIMVTDSESRDSVIAMIDSVAFEDLAERFSIDPSGSTIENAEYLSKSQIHPSIAKKVFSMTKGEVAGPIETEFGYHFVKLIDFAPKGTLREFGEVSQGIRDYLAEQKFQQIFADIIDSLRSVKAVEIDTQAIKEALRSYEK